MRFTVILVFCICLVSTVLAKAESTVEPLSGLNIEKGMISFKVRSTGCTSAEDFELTYKTQADMGLIKIVRTKPDRCRRMPKNLWLSLPMEPEHPNFVVLNPFKTVNYKH